MTKRRGMSLLEVSVAGVLLAALLTVCVQFLGATAARRRAMEDRQTAILEAGNVMERLGARQWHELTPETARAMELSEEAQQSLAEARLEVEVAEVPDEAGARRVAVAVHWEDGSGRPQRPVRLVAWRYRIGEE